MSKRIPVIIKSKIRDLWLLGVNRDVIARHVGIGNGSVSRIIDELRSTDVPDLDMLRAIADKIKNKALDWIAVASYIRFSNILEQMGLSQIDVENLIFYIESHCYRTEQNIRDFVVGINENFKFATELGVSIFKLSDSIDQQKRAKQTLKKEIQELEKQRDGLRIIIRKYQFDYQRIHGKLPDFL